MNGLVRSALLHCESGVSWRCDGGGIEVIRTNERTSKPPLAVHFAGSDAAMSPECLRTDGRTPQAPQLVMILRVKKLMQWSQILTEFGYWSIFPVAACPLPHSPRGLGYKFVGISGLLLCVVLQPISKTEKGRENLNTICPSLRLKWRLLPA
jgi:hypothetical protein